VKFTSDTHYRKFAKDLEALLGTYAPAQGQELLARQRGQLRALIQAEKEFRETLISHHWGRGVYRDFVGYIRDTKRSILSARPFFRERSDVFNAHLSPAFKTRKDKVLYKYRANWNFVKWVLQARKWPKGGKIATIARRISGARQEILQQNLPLALSQARIFWNSTPKSHLSYMDIVQIQCQGLLLAIDKFVPPADKEMTDEVSLAAWKKFRAVGIGYMTRDRINAYSETLLHFYPPDRIKMYRANRALRSQVGDIDFETVAQAVNKDLGQSVLKTTGTEISSLVAAGSTVSGDTSLDPEGDGVLTRQADDESRRPDVMAEKRDCHRALVGSIGRLDMREKKLLQLRGIGGEN
jgi:DNA-directed RNA polymerase specialized sigma subunit